VPYPKDAAYFGGENNIACKKWNIDYNLQLSNTNLRRIK